MEKVSIEGMNDVSACDLDRVTQDVANTFVQKASVGPIFHRKRY